MVEKLTKNTNRRRKARLGIIFVALGIILLGGAIFLLMDFSDASAENPGKGGTEEGTIIKFIRHSPEPKSVLFSPPESLLLLSSEPTEERHGIGHSGDRRAETDLSNTPATPEEPEDSDEPEEIEGCTNPAAINYQPEAEADDGSCIILPDEPINLIATPENFKVAFFGDGGLNNNYRRVLQLSEEEGAELIIHSGDIVNDESPEYPWEWFELMSSALDYSDSNGDGVDEHQIFPYFYSMGNHDDEDWLGNDHYIGYRELLQNRFDALGLSYNGAPEELGSKTSFAYRGLFITLTAPGFAREDPGRNFAGEGHAQFLEEELSNSNHLWQICSWHKLMREIQVGGKGDETGWEVYETCREHGALIANGHEHSYARTNVLSSMQWQIVADEISPYIIHPGQTMSWHAGMGGQRLREQQRCEDGCNGEWATIYTSTQGAVHGALFIEFYVDDDPRKARGYFKNINGEIVDQFELYNRRGMEGEEEGGGGEGEDGEDGESEEGDGEELPESPGEGFVYAHNGELYLDGEEYRFLGVNAFGAANDENIYICGPQAEHGEEPEEYLRSMFSIFREKGINALRFWAFQGYAHSGNEELDFTALDRIFRIANEYGIKVIPVLENQWDHCPAWNVRNEEGEVIRTVPGSFYKQSDWYESGYEEPYGGYVLSFPDYARAVVSRYKDEPAILMWQLLNEAESKPCGQRERCNSTPESAASLLSFTRRMSAFIKSIDDKHLVNLGTMGTGQPGTADENFIALHSLDTIDIVEAHDYEGDEPLPGLEDDGGIDENSVASALSIANALRKPFFIGEAGISADDNLVEQTERANLFEAKISAAFERGGDGYLIWQWNNPAYDQECEGGYCFTAGDPLLDVLGSYS